MIVIAALAAAAVVVMLRGRRAGPDRIGALLGDRPGPAAPASAGSPARILLAAAAMVGCVAGLGLVAGVAVGSVVALGIAVVRRPARPPGVDLDALPVVLDLMAGCLDAGSSITDALDAASGVATEPLRSRCRETAGLLRDGIDATDAWAQWREDQALAPVARTGVRTASSGAAAADDLRRVAARVRAARQAELRRRVQQTSVWLVIPLGICFLPAFALVAVVPVVIGLLPGWR